MFLTVKTPGLHHCSRHPLDHHGILIRRRSAADHAQPRVAADRVCVAVADRGAVGDCGRSAGRRVSAAWPGAHAHRHGLRLPQPRPVAVVLDRRHRHLLCVRPEKEARRPRC